MQHRVLSIHHLHLSFSEECTSLTTAQFLDGFSLRPSFSMVSSNGLQLCTSRLQPCKFPPVSKILVIGKDSGPVMVFNSGCLHEEVIGLIELFRGFISKAQRSTEVPNPVSRCILHKIGTDAVASQKVADLPVVKHTHLISQSSMMPGLSTTILRLKPFLSTYFRLPSA